jgi:hypothetical protein
LREGDQLEKSGIDGRITLKCILKGMGDLDWVEMAQDGAGGRLL